MPTFRRGEVELSYEDRGQGPPVVWVQGVGVAGCGWAPQVQGLSDRFRCISFDHRGIGASSPLGGSLTIDELVEDTLALMDHLGVPRAHLVGHSMGGLIVQDVAHAARERVASLALLCTFTRGTEAARLSPRLGWLGLRTRLGTRAMRRRAFLELILAPGERQVDLDAAALRYGEVFGRDLADSPPVVYRQLAALSRHDREVQLRELSGLPTLVISGSYDPIALPIYGRLLAEAIEGARYVEMPDASHGLPLTRTEEVNQLLAEHFLANP
jgi:pimeloyl-ACP methyl ester carboxylesterase